MKRSTVIIVTLLCCAAVHVSAQRESMYSSFPMLAPIELENMRAAQRAIQFETQSAQLSPSSYTALNYIAYLIKKYPQLRCEIQGHTSAEGTVRENMELSSARAVAVKNYLIAAGAHKSNLLTAGYGSNRPIANNTTLAGRARNMRVELVMINTDELYKDDDAPPADAAETAAAAAVDIAAAMEALAAQGVDTGAIKRIRVDTMIVERIKFDTVKVWALIKSRSSVGFRAGYVNSYASGTSFTKTYFDLDDGLLKDEKLDNGIGAGHGLEAGLMLMLSVAPDFELCLSPSFVYARPFVTDAAQISEYAISVPLLLKWLPFGNSFYFAAGPALDIPFGTKVALDWESGALEDSELKRSKADFGIAAGIGMRVGRHMSLDIRGIPGVTGFDGNKGRRINRASVGLGYVL